MKAVIFSFLNTLNFWVSYRTIASVGCQYRIAMTMSRMQNES